MQAGKVLLNGLVYAFATLLILILILSFLLWQTGMDESGLSFWIYMLHGGAVLVGGFVAGRRSGRQGWYYGGLLGLSYCLILLLVGFLGFDQSISLSWLTLLGVALGGGGLGGIFGVNTSQS